MLPPFLSLIVLVLAWKEWSASLNEDSIRSPIVEFFGTTFVEFFGTTFLVLIIYCMLGLYVGFLRNRFFQELIYLPIYLFSIHVAFRGGSIYGTGFTGIMAFLLVPYYCILSFHLCRMIRELPARKLLLGKDGSVCDITQFQVGLEVDIEGEKFRGSPGKTGQSHNFQLGDIVTVTKVMLNDIIFELKDDKHLFNGELQ